MEIFWLFKLYIKKEKKVYVYHNTQQSLGFVVKLKNKKHVKLQCNTGILGIHFESANLFDLFG